MPADRSFGLVEKKIRKVDTVMLPEEYDKLFSEVGTVHDLNSVFKWVNWQELSQKCVLTGKKFKISDSKRLTIMAKSALVGLHSVYGMEPVCEH